VSLSRAAFAELIPPPYLCIEISEFQHPMRSDNSVNKKREANNAWHTYPGMILSDAIYVREIEEPPVTATTVYELRIWASTQ
jgi:hypothetical protein